MVPIRLIQHKREARWFYAIVSRVYDRWVNPLFWTEPMRDEALRVARLDSPDLRVVDVGAGTGFCTEGVVERVAPSNVTMLDQSPDQLARARAKAALADVEKLQGDAEDLPFATDGADRYISTGSIEYWPDPQRAITEAYRVVKPGGIAMLGGPLPPPSRIGRLMADVWMLFPSEAEYREWFERAGFTDIEVVHVAPQWYRGAQPYALAIAGRKPAPGPSPLALAPVTAEPTGVLATARAALRFAVGGLAGFFFVPVAVVLSVARKART